MFEYDKENQRLVVTEYLSWEYHVLPVFEEEVADNYESLRGYIPNSIQIENVLKEIGDRYDDYSMYEDHASIFTDHIIRSVVIDFIEELLEEQDADKE